MGATEILSRILSRTLAHTEGERKMRSLPQSNIPAALRPGEEMIASKPTEAVSI